MEAFCMRRYDNKPKEIILCDATHTLQQLKDKYNVRFISHYDNLGTTQYSHYENENLTTYPYILRTTANQTVYTPVQFYYEMRFEPILLKYNYINADLKVDLDVYCYRLNTSGNRFEFRKGYPGITIQNLPINTTNTINGTITNVINWFLFNTTGNNVFTGDWIEMKIRELKLTNIKY